MTSYLFFSSVGKGLEQTILSAIQSCFPSVTSMPVPHFSESSSALSVYFLKERRWSKKKKKKKPYQLLISNERWKGSQLSPGTAAQEASLISFPTLVMRKEVPKMWMSLTLHSLPNETGLSLSIWFSLLDSLILSSLSKGVSSEASLAYVH